MDDLEFKQRVLADPLDDGDDLLRAASSDPAKQQFLEQCRQFDGRMRQLLNDIPTPENLRDKLLGLEYPVLAPQPMAVPQPAWYRHPAFAIAASLVLTVALVLGLWSGQPTVQANVELTQEIFGHIYSEIDFLDIEDAVPIPVINAKMSATMVGGMLKVNPDTAKLKVTVADDCWIAKKIAMHLVMKGDRGKITVLLIPNSPVEDEIPISDERFNGFIAPTPRGNLVVLGEKQEASLDRLGKMIANNMDWSY